MSKYKYLILTDLDSTLLNDMGCISKETLDYVSYLNSRDDVIFSFSTGRCWDDSRSIYYELQVKGFVSCNNGSCVCDPRRNIFRYNFLSNYFVNMILKNSKFFEGLIGGKIFSDKDTYHLSSLNIQELLKNIDASCANVFSFKFEFKNGLSVEETDNILNEKMIFLKSLGFDLSIISYKYPDFISIEVHSRLSSKNASAEFLGCFYGISAENILTFGDQINDLSVALGNTRFVAVANSVEILKQNAKIISKYTNNEDCVMREISVFLKNN